MRGKGEEGRAKKDVLSFSPLLVCFVLFFYRGEENVGGLLYEKELTKERTNGVRMWKQVQNSEEGSKALARVNAD